MAKKIDKKASPPDQDPPSEAILDVEVDPEASSDTASVGSDNGSDPADGDGLMDAKRRQAASAYAKQAEDAAPSDAPDAETSDTSTPAASAADAGDAPAGSAESYKALAQRTAAEFENYRKRVKREQSVWRRDILGAFLKEFLPAFDDLDRALAEGEKTTDYDVIHNGVALVRTNLWKTLERVGVKEIEARGNKFDPAYHEAMTAVPAPDTEPNTVIDVYQPGYMIEDFVLRPAKVVVSAPA